MIQVNVLVRYISQEAMKDKPMIKKVKRWSLIAEALTIQGTTVTISDKAVASLTIETNQMLHMRGIGRPLNHEAKIHRDALVAHSGTSRISRGAISMMKLGTSTHRTRIQLSSNGDRGNTLSILVEIRNTMRVKVTETLMPQNAKLISIEMAELIYGIIRVSKLRRQRCHRTRTHSRTLSGAQRRTLFRTHTKTLPGTQHRALH